MGHAVQTTIRNSAHCKTEKLDSKLTDLIEALAEEAARRDYCTAQSSASTEATETTQ